MLTRAWALPLALNRQLFAGQAGLLLQFALQDRMESR